MKNENSCYSSSSSILIEIRSMHFQAIIKNRNLYKNQCYKAICTVK